MPTLIKLIPTIRNPQSKDNLMRIKNHLYSINKVKYHMVTGYWCMSVYKTKISTTGLSFVPLKTCRDISIET